MIVIDIGLQNDCSRVCNFHTTSNRPFHLTTGLSRFVYVAPVFLLFISCWFLVSKEKFILRTNHSLVPPLRVRVPQYAAHQGRAFLTPIVFLINLKIRCRRRYTKSFLSSIIRESLPCHTNLRLTPLFLQLRAPTTSKFRLAHPCRGSTSPFRPAPTLTSVKNTHLDHRTVPPVLLLFRKYFCPC